MDVAIHHAAIGLEIEVRAARPRLGEAHRALEIAARRYLNKGDAGVLLVFGAKPAVVGAALVRYGSVGARLAGRLAKLVAVIVRDIGANEILNGPVLRAALAEVDAAVAHDDLGIDEPSAAGAQAARGSEVGVI